MGKYEKQLSFSGKTLWKSVTWQTSKNQMDRNVTLTGVLGFDSRRGLGIFLFTTASRKALGPTRLPIQWIPGALSLG
jgi:hypothetical protein